MQPGFPSSIWGFVGYKVRKNDKKTAKDADEKQIETVTCFCYFQFDHIFSEFPSEPGKKGTWWDLQQIR